MPVRSLLLSWALLTLSPLALAVEEPRKPNIIVFFTDDHGFADIGCQDVVQDVKTPNIDALAAAGVRMTDGYVTAPQCVPSRAGLLTGMHQNRFGVESNGKPLTGFNNQLTIAERLKRAGYAAGMTGKWHLGPVKRIVDHGFDDVYAKSGARSGWANFNLDGDEREAGPESSKRYHLDANADAACAFIRRHRDQPFFFYCAYRAPHVPLDAPAKYLKRFPGKMPERRRQALAMLSAVDDGVGRVMHTLRELQLEQHTLIFFIGDNGAPLKIHKHDAPGGGPGWDGSLNDPLNGEKGMLSEGGIRVPFIMSWKSVLPVGIVYQHPVTTLDVAATATELAGLPQEKILDGVNLVPAIQDNRPAHAGPLFWRWISQAAIRDGGWKYLRGGPREYLFDLTQDAEEQENVLSDHPELAARLARQLEQWSETLDPPGIETKSLSATWSNYFDFYLDGKPAPPLSVHGDKAGAIQGWLTRNGKSSRTQRALRVVPNSAGRPPFLAQSRLKLRPPVTVEVRLGAKHSGRVGVAWREAGQRDFPRGQSVSVPCAEGEQLLNLELQAKRAVIHLRILLPKQGAEIQSIKAVGKGASQQSWDFSAN